MKIYIKFMGNGDGNGLEAKISTILNVLVTILQKYKANMTKC